MEDNTTASQVNKQEYTGAGSVHRIFQWYARQGRNASNEVPIIAPPKK